LGAESAGTGDCRAGDLPEENNFLVMDIPAMANLVIGKVNLNGALK